jgi:GxxExxY protein
MSNSIRYDEPPKYLDAIGKKVVDAAYKVHYKWGPGLLEHFYQIALSKELAKQGLKVQSQVYLPIILDGERVEDSYRMDLLVENEVVVEIKTVDKLSQVHYRQIRTYLKLSNNRLGFLINFNTERIMDGISREIISVNGMMEMSEQ